MGVVCSECMRGYVVVFYNNFYFNDSTPSFPTILSSSSSLSLLIYDGQISSVVLSLLLALSERPASLAKLLGDCFLGSSQTWVISIIMSNIKGINMTKPRHWSVFGLKPRTQGFSRITRDGGFPECQPNSFKYVNREFLFGNQWSHTSPLLNRSKRHRGTS